MNRTYEISNFELYKFSDMNSNQLLKLYDINSQKIFPDTNSKKHLNKIFEMIRNKLYNKKSIHYPILFLNPENNLDIYRKRKESFQNILKINFSEKQKKDIRNLLSKLQRLDTKISFGKTIYALDSSFERYFFEKYSLNVLSITKKELEEILYSESNNDFIVITDEELFAEFETYSKKEFEKILEGHIIKKNSKNILLLVQILSLTQEHKKDIISSINILTDSNYNYDIDHTKLKELLEDDFTEKIKEATSKALRLDENIAQINTKLKDIISKKSLSLQGDELLELLNSGDTKSLKTKLESDTKELIREEEKKILSSFAEFDIKLDYLFSGSSYPVEIDLEQKNILLEKIDRKSAQKEFETYKKLSSFNLGNIYKALNYAFFFDFFYALSRFSEDYDLKYPKISDNKFLLEGGRNIYLSSPTPISYGLGCEIINDNKLNSEKISVLTGANSGGKTTLLEMFLQAQIFSSMGLGIAADKNSYFMFYDEVYYIKKFSGTQGSGAFEQTIRHLLSILSNESKKLVLIDEFEAITEPGAAVNILVSFLEEIDREQNYCIAVSHLGLDIKDHLEKNSINTIRIDGISAKGIDDQGNLITDHQPEFNELGKSTPEFILKKILNDEKFWKSKPESTKKFLENIFN